MRVLKLKITLSEKRELSREGSCLRSGIRRQDVSCSSAPACKNGVKRSRAFFNYFQARCFHNTLSGLALNLCQYGLMEKKQQIDEFRGKALLSVSEEKSLRYDPEPVIGRKSLWIWPITADEEAQ